MSKRKLRNSDLPTRWFYRGTLRLRFQGQRVTPRKYQWSLGTYEPWLDAHERDSSPPASEYASVLGDWSPHVQRIEAARAVCGVVTVVMNR